MVIERVILCGSVPTDSLPAGSPAPLCLRLWDPGQNVFLRIEDIRRALWREVPPAFRDLLNLAAYVYAADQAISRGGQDGQDFGEDWRRQLFFRIAVREPDGWREPALAGLLADTLSFLTEDEYHFEFHQLCDEPPFTGFFQLTDEGLRESVEEVVLFSGGLDSLGGAVKECLVDRRKVVLVNHRSTAKLATRHRSLVQLLGQVTPGSLPVHLPVHVSKSKGLNQGYTQRSRSLLFVALAAAVAEMLGLRRVRFYENGVVSLNLPPSGQLVGARAWRTTHPRVLAGFGKLLTALAGHRFEVENPFLWHTKAQVVRLITDAGYCNLIRHSTSCIHTWEATLVHPHCGRCSQCLWRRLAVLAAGQNDSDPGEEYAVDLLTGEREEGEPRTLLLALLETAERIAPMNEVQFFGRYGEASRAIPHVAENAEDAAAQIFKLYKQHACEVNEVVKVATGPYASALRRQHLPPNCLIRLVCDAYGPETEFRDHTSPQTPLAENVFCRRGEVWQVRFTGGKEFVLLPTTGAAYLHELLANPEKPIAAVELAYRVTKNPKRFALGDAGEILDQTALRTYRAKLLQLREDLEEAKANHDLAAEARIQEEIEWITSQVREATYKGKKRKAVDDRERIRKAVSNAIHRTLDKINRYDRNLAEHLSPPCLNCGQNPCYTPPSRILWET